MTKLKAELDKAIVGDSNTPSSGRNKTITPETSEDAYGRCESYYQPL